MDENFYRAALLKLGLGTTQSEFAQYYADSSGEPQNSANWNSIFEEGKKVFSKYLDITDENGVIDEKEFNLFSYMLNHIKNLKNLSDFTFSIGHKGNKSATEISRVNQEESDIDKSFPDNLKDIEETKGLKPVAIMTVEEIQNELMTLNPNLELSNLDEQTIRQLLTQYRTYIIDNDKNSNVVDYHIGTFRQHGQQSCASLSNIERLSDDQLRSMVTEKEDENGIYYEVLFPYDNGDESKKVVVRLSEIESNSIAVTHEGNEYTSEAFVEGDYDARLMEMAIAKRFGLDFFPEGSLPSANALFFPKTSDNDLRINFITEKGIIDAIAKGPHAVGLSPWSKDQVAIGYDFVFTSSTGITASWGLGMDVQSNNTRKSKEQELKKKFPEIDESKYLNLNDQEFLEFIMLLEVSGSPIDNKKYQEMSKKEKLEYLNSKEVQGFTYTQNLHLSTGQVIMYNHAYSLKAYNPETKMVTIVEPHTTNEDINIPYDIFEQFFVM